MTKKNAENYEKKKSVTMKIYKIMILKHFRNNIKIQDLLKKILFVIYKNRHFKNVQNEKVEMNFFLI